MVWFVPDAPRRVYAKQQLHVDEMSCFVPGSEQIILEVAGWRQAPALCDESLQMNHADGAARLGAEVYLASVAQPAGNLAKAMLHYPAVARRNAMDVIMANCTGPCDDFVSVGQSAVWNSRGERLAHMGSDSEGVVMLDVDSGTASVHEIAGGSRTREEGTIHGWGKRCRRSPKTAVWGPPLKEKRRRNGLSKRQRTAPGRPKAPHRTPAPPGRA